MGAGVHISAPSNTWGKIITGNTLIGGKHVARSQTDPVKIWFFIVLGLLVVTSAVLFVVVTGQPAA